MNHALPTHGIAASAGLLSRGHAVLICVSAALFLLIGAGLCSAAILVPAPAAAVPIVALSCAGLPLFAGWRLPVAVAALQTPSGRPPALSLAALKRDLATLPETEHPFGH